MAQNKLNNSTWADIQMSSVPERRCHTPHQSQHMSERDQRERCSSLKVEAALNRMQLTTTLTRPCGTETRARGGEGRYIDLWRYRQHGDWQEVLIKSPAAGKPAPLMTICTIKHFSSGYCAPKGSLFILYVSIIFSADALCMIAHRMCSVKGHLQVVEQNSNWVKMYVLKCIKMFPVQLLENSFLHNLSAIKFSFCWGPSNIQPFVLKTVSFNIITITQVGLASQRYNISQYLADRKGFSLAFS